MSKFDIFFVQINSTIDRMQNHNVLQLLGRFWAYFPTNLKPLLEILYCQTKEHFNVLYQLLILITAQYQYVYNVFSIFLKPSYERKYLP